MTDIIIPEEITLPLFVCIGIGKYNFNRVSILGFDPTKYMSEGSEEVLLVESEITLELPKDIDIKSKFLAILEKNKSSIKAEYHMKLKVVQDKIDNLLAIDHQE